MKISAFTCTTNPEYWCFPYQEALRSYLDCFDEVVVVVGESTDGSLEKIKAISDKIKIVYLPWPWDYKQKEYSLHYNFGFEHCTGDWAFKLDCDWIFHETDFENMKKRLEWRNDDRSVMAMNMPKLSMLNKSECHRKGRMVNGIHMKFYRDKIKSGVNMDNPTKSDWTDLVLVEKEVDGIYYGHLIDPNKTLGVGLTIYNYDCFFRTEEKCKTWYKRAALAYLKGTGYPLYGDESNWWETWRGMMEMRSRHTSQIQIKQHPKYIQDKLNSMTPDMWGYNNWDWKL